MNSFKKTEIILPIIIAVICCVMTNPVHNRELLSVVLLGGCLVWSVIWKRMYVPGGVAFYSMLLYTVVILISYLTTIGSSMNYRPLLTQLISVLTFVLIYTHRVRYLKRILASCGCLMSILYVIFYYSPINHNILFFNPNVAAMFFILTLPLCFRRKFWWILSIPILVAMAHYSRGAFGAVVISILVYIFVGKFTLKTKMTLCGLTVVCCVIMTAPITPLGVKFWEKDQFRTMYNNGEESIRIFHGRDYLFREAWTFVKKNPIFGVGVGNMHINSDINNGSSHNLFLTLHSYGGIFALTFFLFPIFLSLKSRFSISITSYLLFAIVSECGANSPPNNIIFWALVAYNLPRDELKLRYNNTHGIYVHNFSLKNFIRITFLCLYVSCSYWTVKHYFTCNLIINSLTGTNGTSLLKKAIELEPKNYKAHYFLAAKLLEERKPRKAKEHFVITEFLCPNFGLTRKALALMEANGL